MHSGDEDEEEALDGLTDRDTLASGDDEIDLDLIQPVLADDDPPVNASDAPALLPAGDDDTVIHRPASPFYTGDPTEPIRSDGLHHAIDEPVVVIRVTEDGKKEQR